MMSKYTPDFYTVTAHKATAANASDSGHLITQTDLNFIVAKLNTIELYLFVEESLILISEILLKGKIEIMKVFRPIYKEKDLIFVVTSEYLAVVLECIQEGDKVEIVTKASFSVFDNFEVKTGFKVLIDPDNKIIGLKLFQGLFQIIPLNKEDEFNVHSIRLEETNIQDIAFLHGCINPTILIIYENFHGQFIKSKQLTKHFKRFLEGYKKSHYIEGDALMIIPIPKPFFGSIIIGRKIISYCNQFRHCEVNHCSEHKNRIVCYTKINSEEIKYLLGDKCGNLYILHLMACYQNKPKINMIDLNLKFVGEISIPKSLTYLNNDVVYVASVLGDSQLIKFYNKADESNKHIKVLDVFYNLGPIVDMCVINSDEQEKGRIVTCSGAYKDGSLRVIYSGIGIQELATIDLAGIIGIWPLSLYTNNDLKDTLVLSFVGYSKILTSNGEEVEEIDFEGFQSESQTLYCGNTLNNKIVQITSKCVRLICLELKKCINKWTVPDCRNIDVVTSDSQKIICAAGKYLYYLEIGSEQIYQKSFIILENEVSCLDIYPFKNNMNETVILVAVGLWINTSIKILQLPDFVEIIKEPLIESIVPRSITLITFDDIHYLFCALGNGNLCYFYLDLQNGILSNRRMIKLSNRPASIRKFQANNTTSIFLCSDNPTIIYSFNSKLIFSNLNMKKVNNMYSFNSENYPNCLAIVTDTYISICSIDKMVKLHVYTIPLEETPWRITYQRESESFCVTTIRTNNREGFDVVPSRPSASTKTKNVTSALQNGLVHNNEEPINMSLKGYNKKIKTHHMLILHRTTFEVLHAYQLYTNEYAVCVISTQMADDPLTYYILGTVIFDENNGSKKGRIVVFLYDMSSKKLLQVHEVEIVGGCYSLSVINGKLLAASKYNIQIYRWYLHEFIMETVHINFDTFQHIKTKGDYILCCDLKKSLTLYQYKLNERSLLKIVANDSPKWSTAIEMMDENFILSVDDNTNLYVFHKNSEIVNDEITHDFKAIGQIHLGDLLNVFKHGSLLSQQFTDTYDTLISFKESIIYGTVNGALGIITRLSPKIINFLLDFKKSLVKVIKGMDNVTSNNKRINYLNKTKKSINEILDGDLIKTFLNLSESKMISVIEGLTV